MRLTQIPDASPAELFKKYQKVSTFEIQFLGELVVIFVVHSFSPLSHPSNLVDSNDFELLELRQ